MSPFFVKQMVFCTVGFFEIEHAMAVSCVTWSIAFKQCIELHMYFNLPKFSTKIPAVLIRQSFLPPKFITIRYIRIASKNNPTIQPYAGYWYNDISINPFSSWNGHYKWSCWIINHNSSFCWLDHTTIDLASYIPNYWVYSFHSFHSNVYSRWEPFGIYVCLT